MGFLNYHHLRYFRAIANEGNLTQAAARLRISQSALSIQLKRLEQSLGHSLFERVNKSLKLTDTGKLVLDYAESIFRTGEELMQTLERHSPNRRKVLSVGAVSTLSRNFQIELLRPLLNRPDIELVLQSGSLRTLLTQLGAHSIDLVLSNLPVKRDAETGWHSHLLSEQPVSLVSKPIKPRRPFRFPEDLKTTPIVLPSLDSNIRSSFDLVLEQAGIRPMIAAEVDDMAMLRLLARETHGVTLVPPVVVQDELKQGLLIERHRFPGIKECFYAITPSRTFPNEIVRELIRPAKH